MNVEVRGVDVKEIRFRKQTDGYVAFNLHEIEPVEEAVIKHEIKTSIGVVIRTIIMPKEKYAELTLKQLEQYILTEAGVFE